MVDLPPTATPSARTISEVPMARRAGKAASRKARQRYVPKTPRPAPATAPQAASAEPMEPTVARGPTSADAPRRTAPAAYASGGSTLSVRERAEYHYVERDLRNIGVLSLVMVAMLVAAYFLFNALGIIR